MIFEKKVAKNLTKLNILNVRIVGEGHGKSTKM